MSDNTFNDIESCDTLYKLLEQYEVRIPIIQRDYAQGRSNEKANEVRKRLLDDIILVLSTNKRLDFNFVYGNRIGKIFYPVDGQQRLTTLYLLHWFLASRMGGEELLQFNKLNKFSYMTRNSASEFFNLLKKPESELISIMKKPGDLTKIITDYAWFRAEWHNDPTVISALNMLNDMCNRVEFKNKEAEFYERLININSPTIHFKVLIESGETADSAETAAAIRYIRMNARGKVLTTFENVKAMLDGIDEKLQEKSTKIIFDYDTKFIDIFYSKASDEYANMDGKSEEMDKETMCFFRNMYNVAADIYSRVKFDDDTDYANEMYKYSQRHLTGNEDFFSFYFNMMEAVLRIRKKDAGTAKFVDAAFDENFTGQTYMVEKYRIHVAWFLYVYHLYMKHLKTNDDRTNFSVSIEKIEKYDYVLSNLMYVKWSDASFEVINKLAREVADATDIIEYFGCTSFDITGLIININLPDIKQRIKEQHIKAKIIKYKKYRYDIFRELEERFEQRKLQYLLWISGLWTDNVLFDEKDIDSKLIAMEKYMKTASRYFQNANRGKDMLTWRKLFAIGGNWDEIGNELLDSETINKNTSDNWEDCSYWNDDTYFWNDNDTPNENKLRIVKRTYDLISTFTVVGLIKQAKSQLKDICWLKYAISKDHVELLTNKVILTLNNFLQIRINGSFRSYMPYVLLLDKGHMIEGNYAHSIYKRNAYSGFGICQLIGLLGHKEIILRLNKVYTHTNRSDISSHRDSRNYKMKFEGIVDITFNNVPLNTNTIFIVEDDTYSVYQYQKESNDFLYFSYSLISIRNDINVISRKIAQEFDKIETEFSNEDFNRVLEVKYGVDHFWKHEGGNNRTWIHKEATEYQLLKGNNYKITI